MPHISQRPATAAPVARRAVLGLIATGIIVPALLPAMARVPGYESLGQVRSGLRSGDAIVERVGESVIQIVFADGAPGLDRTTTLAWVRQSAATVSAYFGRFPVDAVAILIVAQDGDRVGHATTWGYDGSTIRIGVGRDTAAAAYARDWVMVHEMMHLALPGLPDHQHWALEGSATYAEPVARVQRGEQTAEEIWGGMMRGMPQGLPMPGDRGLDQTATWGRTYWGGSVFYLLADIRIRQATGNAKGLQHAFRAINRASGGNTAQWTMDELVVVGDRATGADVLTTLYAEMKDKPVPVDLPLLFRQLGVVANKGMVQFDDGAPLAEIRKAITAPLR